MNFSSENIVEQVADWLSGLSFDKGTYGRYRICKSAYHTFSLDASSLATDLVYMLKLPLSENEKDQQAAFFNSLQDPETGFYHEPFVHELYELPIERVVEMSGTYLSFQVSGALRALQHLPIYPFRFYEFTLKAGAVIKYIEENFPWDKSPWGAGGWIDSMATMLQINIEMGFTDYQEVLDAIFKWLDLHQDPSTGFWGNISSQGVNGLINGGYHIMRGTYLWHKKEFNYPKKMVDSILTDLRTNPIFDENSGHGCQDLDHFFLLEKVHSVVPHYRSQEIAELSRKRLDIILRIMRKNSEGFSFEADNAVKVHNYYRVSPGHPESDLQGTLFYLQTLLSILRIIGETPKQIWRNSLTHGTKMCDLPTIPSMK